MVFSVVCRPTILSFMDCCCLVEPAMTFSATWELLLVHFFMYITQVSRLSNAQTLTMVCHHIHWCNSYRSRWVPFDGCSFWSTTHCVWSICHPSKNYLSKALLFCSLEEKWKSNQLGIFSGFINMHCSSVKPAAFVVRYQIILDNVSLCMCIFSPACWI